MKFGAAILLFFSFLVPGNTQENASSKQAVSPPIGLQVGQRAPAFASRDQLGHDQSIQTLEGSSGTVLLFFRSADW